MCARRALQPPARSCQRECQLHACPHWKELDGAFVCETCANRLERRTNASEILQPVFIVLFVAEHPFKVLQRSVVGDHGRKPTTTVGMRADEANMGMAEVSCDDL